MQCREATPRSDQLPSGGGELFEPQRRLPLLRRRNVRSCSCRERAGLHHRRQAPRCTRTPSGDPSKTRCRLLRAASVGAECDGSAATGATDQPAHEPIRRYGVQCRGQRRSRWRSNRLSRPCPSLYPGPPETCLIRGEVCAALIRNVEATDLMALPTPPGHELGCPDAPTCHPRFGFLGRVLV